MIYIGCDAVTGEYKIVWVVVLIHVTKLYTCSRSFTVNTRCNISVQDRVIAHLRIIRPHRSTTYVDVPYSYRPSSVVCWSVGLSVTLVSPAKTAAPIELPFGLRTWVGPGNHVLDGGPDPPMGRGNFVGERGIPL